MAIGVLLVNVGTPDAPEIEDIRRYLYEFMSDSRVINRSGPWWRFLLKHVIVPKRAPVSAKAYREIWIEETDESPLRAITRAQVKSLRSDLRDAGDIRVRGAMRYGSPSIADEIAGLRDEGCNRLLIVPLYPQFSGATTASVADKVCETLSRLPDPPALRTVPPYYDDPGYVAAIATGIRAHMAGLDWRPETLLLSFHGLPQAHIDHGDPYRNHCETTADMLRAELGDLFRDIPLVFQSRGRRVVWTGPELEDTLAALARSGTANVCVATPGFATDCLETIEEVAIRAAQHFVDNGGCKFSHVPCLNDSADASALIASLVRREIHGWV